MLSPKALIELIQAKIAKGASFRLEAKGSSMLPFIRNSDAITISALRNYSIDFGKPVAFIDPKTNKLVIHRIVGRKNSSYLIKGDSAFGADGLIPKANILGCVVRIERKGRNISLGLGWERLIIVLLSRIKVWYLIVRLWMLLPLSIRNTIKSAI